MIVRVKIDPVSINSVIILSVVRCELRLGQSSFGVLVYLSQVVLCLELPNKPHNARITITLVHKRVKRK